MKIIAFTQVWENYGSTHKPKGGDEHVLGQYTMQEIASIAQKGNMPAFVRRLIEKKGIEVHNENYEEYVIDWEIVEDNYRTQFTDFGDR